MVSHKNSVLFLVIAGLLWSTSGVLLKSMPSVHWLAIAGLRSAFAAIIFLPGLAQRRPPLTRLLPVILLYVVVVSALMGAMQLGTAAQGIWLQYIAPAVVAVWAWLIHRQRIRPAELAAVLLTVIAVILIVTGGNGLAHRQSALLGVTSGISFGLLIIVLKTLGDTPPAGLFFWTNLSAAAIIIPAGLASGVAFPTAPREIALMATMGIFQLGLAYYFFQLGLARTRAVEASLIVLLEPIFNPIWVYLVLGEMPGVRVAMACGLIALALVAMAILPNRRR